MSRDFLRRSPVLTWVFQASCCDARAHCFRTRICVPQVQNYISVDYRSTIGRLSVDYRPIVVWQSTDISVETTFCTCDPNFECANLFTNLFNISFTNKLLCSSKSRVAGFYFLAEEELSLLRSRQVSNKRIAAKCLATGKRVSNRRNTRQSQWPVTCALYLPIWYYDQTRK